MGQAIGSTISLAIGVALSPLPIIAVVLMLTSERARVNGLVFVLGWLIGLAVVGTIVLLVAGSASAGEAGTPATWVGWLDVVLGLLVLRAGFRQFRGRPKKGESPDMPKWLAAVERISPVRALALAAALAAVNPKNLLLAVAAATSIAQTSIPGGQQAVAYTVFAVIATIGVAAPVVIYFALGDRAPHVLGGLKDWMAHNNAVIMAVLCLLIGVKLIGDAIGVLSS
ncbi:GAP family protein [Catenulispora subtropica]|uniref:GAP family protein n=1 Tax=Catenulispora subtropica TaxID=450798 RepID=A0ABN2RML1_9ACTN